MLKFVSTLSASLVGTCSSVVFIFFFLFFLLLLLTSPEQTAVLQELSPRCNSKHTHPINYNKLHLKCNHNKRNSNHNK